MSQFYLQLAVTLLGKLVFRCNASPSLDSVLSVTQPQKLEASHYLQPVNDVMTCDVMWYDLWWILKWVLVRIASFCCMIRYEIWIPEFKYYRKVSVIISVNLVNCLNILSIFASIRHSALLCSLSSEMKKYRSYLGHRPPEYVVIMQVSAESSHVHPHLLHTRHLPHLLLCWGLGKSCCSALSLCCPPRPPLTDSHPPLTDTGIRNTHHLSTSLCLISLYMSL